MKREDVPELCARCQEKITEEGSPFCRHCTIIIINEQQEQLKVRDVIINTLQICNKNLKAELDKKEQIIKNAVKTRDNAIKQAISDAGFRHCDYHDLIDSDEILIDILEILEGKTE